MPDLAPRPLVALGFDFGSKRIGVAAGDTLTGTARPLGIVTCGSDGTPDWAGIGRHVKDWDPEVFVVGVPYNMNGTPTELTTAATEFGTALEGRHGRRLVMVDERLSSREAEEMLRQRRASGSLNRRVTRGDIDAVSAVVLLQQWLRERNLQTRT
jgi:putative Holliday junction resolvase